jgi:hypothetical protein
MMLDHYTQTKCPLVSHDPSRSGSSEMGARVTASVEAAR